MACELTVTVVVQVAQLIAPLSDNSQRILQEGDYDEETAYRWEISIYLSQPVLSYVSSLPLFPSIWRGAHNSVYGFREYSRLNRLTQRIQKILNLARLCSNRLQWAGILSSSPTHAHPRVHPHTGASHARAHLHATASAVLSATKLWVSEVIVCCSADLRHCEDVSWRKRLRGVKV